MAFRWSRPGEVDDNTVSRLSAAVRTYAPELSSESQLLVTAVAGLLGSVAFADHEYSGAEAARVREELLRVQGLDRQAVDAVCAILKADIVELSTIDFQYWARILRDDGTRELRVEVLNILMDLAAIDDDVSVAETNTLRRITVLFGLSEQDYLSAQDRHRDKLSVLKAPPG
jgi:uncharacterized tellurite resistance protein B-like protein